MNCITVFNNKGGVGKTSLVYHLAWMYAELDYNVLVADLDPQANLTSMFLDDDELEELWTRDGAGGTIYSALRPLLEGTGDVTMPHVVEPETGIGLVAGDMLLSGAEDELSSQWPDCLDRKPRAFRVLSALWRALRMAADEIEGRPDPRRCRPKSGRPQSSCAGDGGSRGRATWRPISTPSRGSAILGRRLRRWRQGVGRNECNATPCLTLTFPAGR